jgi:hypothetical protein
MSSFDAKGFQDKEDNELRFTPTHFLDAQGNPHSIEVEFGKKQDTLSEEADSNDVSDATKVVIALSGSKLKTSLATKFWNYIKGKLGFNNSTSRYSISISGTASSADKLVSPSSSSSAITGKENEGGYLSRAYRTSGSGDNGYPESFGNVFTIGGKGGSQLFLAWSGTTKGIAKIYYRNRRDVATTDGDCWSEWKALAWENHTHDGRYYTESEIDTLLLGKQNNIGRMGSENQPVYFDENGHVQACPVTTDDPNDVVVNFRVIGARYANAAGSANTASNYNQSAGTIKTALEQKQDVIGPKGSAAQPVYFDANGHVQAIPIDQSVGGTCLSLYVSNANYATSAESASIATKDSSGQQINTTYLRISDAALTYARIVNIRVIENHTYSLQGTSTDTTAFEINFLGYDQLPAGRPTMLLISMQYECAGGTALSFKFKYGSTTLGASSLPDGRHYVTLPVVWNAAHSVLTQNPFSLCFSGVSGASIHVMGGSLTLM